MQSSENERLSGLFRSPVFFQKLISLVPPDQRSDLAPLLAVYQQEGQTSPQSYDSACSRLNSLHVLIQLYQVTQLGGKFNVARIFLRFALIDPLTLPEEICAALAALPVECPDVKDIFYQDEWLANVGNQTVKGLASTSGDSTQKPQELGKYRSRLDQFEQQLKESVVRHQNWVKQFVQLQSIELPRQNATSTSRLLNGEQQHDLAQLQQLIQHILRGDRDFRQLYEQRQQLASLINEKGLAEHNQGDNASALRLEIKQLQRLRRSMEGEESVPHSLLQARRFSVEQLGSRERVAELITVYEQRDPGLFVRRFRNNFHRYPPRVLLLPCHAASGLCWEAFDRHDRAHSHGLIALPMYSPNVHDALINALGQLRWMTAKKLAANYWLSEGITGQYSAWLHKNRSKSNEQEHFIRDYRQWLLFESQGYQRLPTDVRSIFWQWIPFPKDLCEQLSKRHSIYADLHRRYPPGKKPGEVKVSLK